MLVFPAPVGPVIPNSSSSEKSIVWRSRKAVKPSTSSLSGFTRHLLQQLVEHGHDLGRRGRTPLRGVVALKQLSRREPARLPVLALTRRTLVVQTHVQRIGEEFAHVV